MEPRIGRGLVWGSPWLGVSPRLSLISRLRGAWYGGAQGWEGPAVGEPIIGSDPEGFVEPMI